MYEEYLKELREREVDEFLEYKKAKAKDALELRMAADRGARKMMLSQLSYHRWAWESIRGCFSDPQIKDGFKRLFDKMAGIIFEKGS